MRLEVLNGFSRFTPDLMSQDVPDVQLEGRFKPKKFIKKIAKKTPVGFVASKIFEDDDNNQRQEKRRARRQRRRAKRNRANVMVKQRQGRAKIRQGVPMQRQRPRPEQLKQLVRQRRINGITPDTAEDIKEYCLECSMNGITPTLDDYLNGKKERQERRKARKQKRADRKEKRAERKTERGIKKAERQSDREERQTTRQDRRDKKKDERIERKDRRADRKEKRQTTRQERKEQRADRKDKRIEERRLRQEGRQQARQDRVEARTLRKENRGDKLSKFGENLTSAASSLIPGAVDEFGFEVPQSFQDFIPDELGFGNDNIIDNRDKEIEEETGGNFWQKYGVWLALGGSAFLLLRANKSNKKRAKR